MATGLEHRADPPFLVVPMEPVVAYIPNKPDASIEFDFEVEQDGTYRIDAVCLYAVFAGIYQPYLDGEPIGGPIDFVLINYDPAWLRLDTHELEAGTHTLRFEGTGEESPGLRAQLPKFHGFGLAAITLLRLEDMEGYHQVRDRLLEKK